MIAELQRPINSQPPSTMLMLQRKRLVEQVYGGLHDTHSDTSNQARPFSSAAVLASLMVAEPAAAAAAAAAQPVPPPASSDQIVITGTRRTDRTVTNSASPIDVIGSTGADQPAERQPARHGQEHRPVLLCPAEQRFRTPRASFARRRCAACPATKCWCRSTASASTARPWSRSISVATPALSFGSQGADISAIPCDRASRTCRFCATARPRNMARTPSPAS